MAPCPVFGTCGGCQLQHMDYQAQLLWKREVVRQLLRDIGGFADPPLLDTVACDDPWHYRNHMRFSVNRDGQPGLTARGSHRVLPLDECPIAHQQINKALGIVKQHVNPRPQVLIRCATASNQMLLQPAQNEEVTAQLTAAGLEIHTETMEEVLGKHTFRIRPSSFFQTNSAQAEKMAAMVINGLLADKTTEQARKLTIVDAYCGVGTFAALLAPRVGKVIAIEESPSAIKDAQWNMRDVEHVEILKGKVEDVLPGLAQDVDGFVIDPPRAGCQQVVLDTLIRHPVARIVYVSCDPATLARDLNILCHLNPTYHLRSIQPLDMFPQTAHIENVAVLEHIP
jgi:23S rRNA (uracil1939-C5)-methyltransferase